MPIIIGKNTITQVVCNGVACKNVICNGVEVFSGRKYIMKDGKAGELGGGFILRKQSGDAEWTLAPLNSNFATYANTQGGSHSRVDTRELIEWSKYKKLCISWECTSSDRYNNLIMSIANGSPNTGVWLPNADPTVTQTQAILSFADAGEKKTYELKIPENANTGILMLGISDISPTAKIADIYVE